MIHYEVFVVISYVRVVLGQVQTDVPIRTGEGLSLGVGDEAQDYKVVDVGNWCETSKDNVYTVTHHALIVEPV